MTTKFVTGTIIFPNRSCLALWQAEILGQLSDGAWENSKPDNHWRFWHHLVPLVQTQTLAKPGIVVVQSIPYDLRCHKNSYGLVNKLFSLLKDRMLMYGRMCQITDNPEIILSSEYLLGMSREQFVQRKETGKWQYEFLGERMENISIEMFDQFLSKKYSEKELRSDLITIGKIMMTAEKD